MALTGGRGVSSTGMAEAPRPPRSNPRSPVLALDAPTAAGVRIDVLDDRGLPPEIGVQTGATVAWINRGTKTYRIAALDGRFDSGPLGPGETFAHCFDEPRCHTYICEQHSIRGLTGRIVVQP